MRGNHWRDALTLYEGQAPTPFATYQPPVMGNLLPFELGICSYTGGGQVYAQLLDKRRRLTEESDAINDSIDARGGGPSEGQRARLSAILADLDPRRPGNLAAQIAAEETRRERARTAPAADASASRTVIESITSGGDTPRPFANLGEQLQAVYAAAAGRSRNAPADPRLQSIQDYQQMLAGPSGASESVGADGGFAVQTDFSNELLTNVWQTGQLAKRARHIPISAGSNRLQLNVIDETSRATGSRWGGVQAYWLAEAAAFTGSRPKIRPLQMELAKLIGLFYATDELVQDAQALSEVATEAFTEEFGFQLDDAMIRGSGAGIPLGILNSGALVTVPKETGQSAASVVAENIMKMYARMPARCLETAIWTVNQALMPQIFQLYIPVGTGGIPMFVPSSSGMVGAPAGTLMGRPIVPIEQASAPGTVGDITFSDFSEYVQIEKGGITAASSIHVLFLTDEMTFRWTLRTNGQPRPVAPITPYKGSDQISPFVALAAR